VSVDDLLNVSVVKPLTTSVSFYKKKAILECIKECKLLCIMYTVCDYLLKWLWMTTSQRLQHAVTLPVLTLPVLTLPMLTLSDAVVMSAWMWNNSH